jgi:hypothetical protein
MKKILVVFIYLIFSNTTFAIPGWFGPDNARCKVNYTRLNLITGIETNIKITTQYTDRDSLEHNCNDGSWDLSDKIEDWMKKSRLNIVADLSVMYCKTRTDDGIFSNVWSDYKQCSTAYSKIVSGFISGRYPNQMGYEAYKCNLIGITQEDLDPRCSE